MKMTLEQTALVGLTMKLDLCAQEYKQLKEEYEAKKAKIDVKELALFQARFQEKQKQINTLKEKIKSLAQGQK